MSRLSRPSRLTLERLEDRLTPVAFGNPWPDPGHLTVSFAPDGTQVADQTSALFRTFDALAPTSAWQMEVLRAFQTWAVNANINVSVTADGGQPFGTPGAIQGDPRFGDVRVAAFPMGSDMEGLAAPFEATGGTWAGDVKFNSQTPWSVGGGGGGSYDLFTVALHEAGHVFGLDHSPNPAAVMFKDYMGPRTGLSAEDVARLQALYGARSPDAFEGSAGNDTVGTATPLSLLTNADGSLSISANADITTLQDKDVYRFTTPLVGGNLAVRVETGGLSLLAPKVTVYDWQGRVVGSAVTTDPLAGGVTVRVPGLSVLSTYYVKVEGGRGDVFGVGGYQLRVSYVPLVNSVGGAVTSATDAVLSAAVTAVFVNDFHTDDTFLTALNLQQLVHTTDSHFDYSFRGSISDSWDVDNYRIQAPTPAAGSPNVLTAMVWSPDGNLVPRLGVYDAQYNPVAAQVLVSEGGSYTIQIANATAGATYYVQVRAATPKGANNVGNYFLGIDFSTQAEVQQTYVDQTLADASRQAFYTMTLGSGQLNHFVLSADPTGGVAAAVRMTIYDVSGSVVFTVMTAAGDAVSGNVFLPAGTYSVRFAAGTRDGSPLPPLHMRLLGGLLSDPNGPQPNDQTASPAGSNDSAPPPPPPQWNSGSSSSTGLQPNDPYSDPYYTY
jgi:hypothetical protein